MDRLLRELCKSHSHCSPFIHPCSAAGLQLHDGETGRDRGGHGRRPLLAVKERLSGMTSPRLWIPDYDATYNIEDKAWNEVEHVAVFGLGCHG